MIGADPRGFGERAHIPAVKSSNLMELSAVCTAHEATARAAAERHQVRKWYAGVDALVSDPEIDLVTIAVRPRHHLALAAAALQAGKAVYCEWPLARTTEEAWQVVELAEKTGTPNAVGLQGRFAPAIETMRRMISDGQIGAPLMFEASLLQSPFQVDSDRSWLSEISEASGALHVATAHVTDAVQHVLGKLAAVAAITDTLIPEASFGDTGEAFKWNTPDTVAYIARLEQETPGVVSVSNATRPPLGFNFRVMGEQGQLRARSPEYFQFSPIQLELGRNGSFEPLASVQSGNTRDENDPSTNVARALEAFCQSVTDSDRFTPGFRDGLDLHRLIDSVAHSADASAWRTIAR